MAGSRSSDRDGACACWVGMHGGVERMPREGAASVRCVLSVGASWHCSPTPCSFMPTNTWDGGNYIPS